MIPESKKTDPARILIIRTSSIGDVVLATAALEYIREWSQRTGRAVEMHWAAREPALGLLREACPDLKCHEIEDLIKNHTDTLPGPLMACVDLQGNLRSRKLARRVARHHQVVVTRASKRYLARGLLVAASRIFGRSGPSLALQRALLRLQPPVPQYNLAVNAMARALGENDEAIRLARPRLAVGQADPRIDPSIKWLAVAPGASHPSKKAPARVFERVLGAFSGKINPESPTGIVILGDQRERPDCEELERRLKANQWEGPVLNLAGSTTIAGTVSVLASCQAVLCNDSSLGHISESLGKPSVVLFGPTIEAFGFAPQLPASKAFSAALGCRPCSKHGKSECRYGDLACFEGIDTRAAGDTLGGIFE